MFCENCGKANPDGVKFCEGCGASLEAAAPAAASNAGVKKIGILAGAVALVIILLAIFGVFEAGSIKALKKANNGWLNAKAKNYVAVMYSPYSDMEKDELKELTEKLQEQFEDAKQERKDEKIKYTYKNYKVSKKYKKSEVNDIAEYLSDNYNYDTDEYKLQAVQVVKYTEVRKDEDDTDSETIKQVMMKVKGKWYICPLDVEQIDSILDED